MDTIQHYLDYSILSFASYGVGLSASGDNTAALKVAKMTQSQIDQFLADGWEVVNQSSDALYGSSGFSATLFHNTKTDEYVFANRGTEPSLNYLAK